LVDINNVLVYYVIYVANYSTIIGAIQGAQLSPDKKIIQLAGGWRRQDVGTALEIKGWLFWDFPQTILEVRNLGQTLN